MGVLNTAFFRITQGRFSPDKQPVRAHDRHAGRICPRQRLTQRGRVYLSVVAAIVVLEDGTELQVPHLLVTLFHHKSEAAVSLLLCKAGTAPPLSNPTSILL